MAESERAESAFAEAAESEPVAPGSAEAAESEPLEEFASAQAAGSAEFELETQEPIM